MGRHPNDCPAILHVPLPVPASQQPLMGRHPNDCPGVPICMLCQDCRKPVSPSHKYCPFHALHSPAYTRRAPS
eukprot:1319-Chlamydomonas_euryale.AAC.1